MLTWNKFFLFSIMTIFNLFSNEGSVLKPIITFWKKKLLCTHKRMKKVFFLYANEEIKHFIQT